MSILGSWELRKLYLKYKNYWWEYDFKSVLQRTAEYHIPFIFTNILCSIVYFVYTVIYTTKIPPDIIFKKK